MKATWCVAFFGCAVLVHGAILRVSPLGSGKTLSDPSSELLKGGLQEGAGSLPIFVPGEGKQDWLQKLYPHNFTKAEVAAFRRAKAHGLVREASEPCDPAMTIHDFGFFDGGDSLAYLNGGYCVVGVEADPDLASAGLHNYAQHVVTGKLRIVNAAIAPSSDAGKWTTFYKSKCTKEWNSFYKTTACRDCTNPTVITEVGVACEEVKVQSMTCAQVLDTFGTPQYLKLDIEGAEPGCFQAVGTNRVENEPVPRYISAEITTVDYLDQLYNIGYTRFKLVRQDVTAVPGSSRTGPWGENALDCMTGPMWRSYAEVRQEMLAILNKPWVSTDKCPGGILPSRSTDNVRKDIQPGSTWYDVHATP